MAASPAFSTDGEVRSAFNDVDDYNNLDNQPPVLLSGSSFASTYPDYRVQISVVCAGTEVGLPNDDFAKRIEITVTTPTGEQLTLNAYLSYIATKK